MESNSDITPDWAKEWDWRKELDDWGIEEEVSPDSFYNKLSEPNKIAHKLTRWLRPFYVKYKNEIPHIKCEKDGKEGTLVRPQEKDEKYLDRAIQITPTYPEISVENDVPIAGEMFPKAIGYKFVGKIYTNTNEYTLVLEWEEGKKAKDCYFSLYVTSREVRAGEFLRKNRSLNGGPPTEAGWRKMKDEILKYEVLDSINDKWKNISKEAELLIKK